MSSLKGLWCSGITSASHAEGPGFEPRRIHIVVASVRADSGERSIVCRAAPRRAAPEPATSNNNASPGPWFSDPLRLCTKKCPNQDLNLGCRGHNATS